MLGIRLLNPEARPETEPKPSRVGFARSQSRRPRSIALLLGLLSLPPGFVLGQPAPLQPYQLTSAPPEGLGRETLGSAALQHVQNLIRIDTQNPPGNEKAAALYLQQVFQTAGGFETHILEVPADPNEPNQPPRASFLARLKSAAPTGRPVLILGHLDVVGVQRAQWDSDPFAAEIRDGYLYGRGAIDDKGMLAACVTALLELGREAAAGKGLQRDVLFLATAAEEGGPDVGIDLVLRQHRDLLGDVEFALNEGGRIRIDGDRIVSVNVQTTEKVPYNIRGVATGPSGHGSVPLPDNALAALARAVSRIHAWKPPARLNPTTQLYFRQLATIEKDPVLRQAMQQAAGEDPVARDAALETLSAEPLHNAVLRTGLSLTLIQGGIRSNVIPSEGEATFNVRLLPGENIQDIVREMNRVAAEPKVRFEFTGEPRPDPPPSSVETGLYAAIQKTAVEMVPGVVVLPFMSTGATDGAALRAAGIPTYGLLVLPLPQEDELRMHGNNERAPLGAFGWGAEFVYRTLKTVASP